MPSSILSTEVDSAFEGARTDKNTSSTSGFFGEVIVDLALNPIGAPYQIRYTNKVFRDESQEGAAPSAVLAKRGGSVRIQEVNGTVSTGPARTVAVNPKPMEIQILELG